MLDKALDHLAKGEWQAAHDIVQKDESTLASWLHGIVHILEGDQRNAEGWYKKAGREFPGMTAAPAEIEAARRELARAG